MPLTSEKDCRHDNGFTFVSARRNVAADRMPGKWLCNHGCGFFLNFNPEGRKPVIEGGYDGIAYAEQPSGKTKDYPFKK